MEGVGVEVGRRKPASFTEGMRTNARRKSLLSVCRNQERSARDSRHGHVHLAEEKEETCGERGVQLVESSGWVSVAVVEWAWFFLLVCVSVKAMLKTSSFGRSVKVARIFAKHRFASFCLSRRFICR